MRNCLSIFSIAAIGICVVSSCSSRRNSSSADGPKKTKITGLTTTVGRPSPAVIRATGDELSPGINSHNRTTGSSQENAVAIANEAISRANSTPMNMSIKLDTLTSTEFVNMLSSSNNRQMKITRLALKDTDNAKIKSYANLILKDHQRLQADLDKLSSNASIRQESLVVAKLTTVDPSAQQKNTNEFIQMTIEDHQNMIRLLESASRSNDAGLKAFGNRYLPLLQKHLSAAQDLTIQ